MFVRKPADISVADKKQARLECEVNGIPIPTVEWFKNGILLQNSDNIQIECKNKVINILTIKSVNSEFSGTYAMKAKNEIGEAEASVNLGVDGIQMN